MNSVNHDRSRSKKMETTSKFWVGADPGGRDNFGLAFLDDACGTLRCYTASSVDEATNRILDEGEPEGMGIDAPMWWSSREGGGRKADERIRDRYTISSGTVQSVNSLRGAALVGGLMLAFRIREKFPRTGITESHPKALLKALGETGFAKLRGIAETRETEHERDAAIAAINMLEWLARMHRGNEHERDAAIAAICAREGFSGRWTTDLVEKRHDSEQDPKSHWLGPVHYYWPESI